MAARRILKTTIQPLSGVPAETAIFVPTEPPPLHALAIGKAKINEHRRPLKLDDRMKYRDLLIPRSLKKSLSTWSWHPLTPPRQPANWTAVCSKNAATPHAAATSTEPKMWSAVSTSDVSDISVCLRAKFVKISEVLEALPSVNGKGIDIVEGLRPDIVPHSQWPIMPGE
jgi:hypothetical protein